MDSRRPARHVEIEDPTTIEERTKVAGTCSDALELSMPFLIDDMDDTVGKAYSAHPDRLFIVSADGKVAYRGDRGPRGFDPDAMEKALEAILAPDTK